MAALPPVANCLRVQLKHTLGTNTDVLCRFFVLYAGTAPNDTQLNAFCSSVSGAWGTNLKAFCNGNWSLTEVITTDLSSSTAAVGSYATPVAGTRTGNALSPGTAVIVKFLIGRRYRGGHPRIYLPYFTATDLANSTVWNTTSTANLLTSWTAFMTAVLALTWTGATISNQVNVHYFHGFTNFTFPSGRVKAIPTPLATPTTDVVTTYSVVAQPASQRRRNLTA